MSASNADAWLHLLGRLHPVVLHVPIGVLAALALLEAFAWVRRRPIERGVRLLVAWMAAVSAGLAAASGWFLAEEPDYGGSSLILHRNLALALTACTVVAATGLLFGARRLYGWMLLAAVGLMIPVGHLGGSMTHGEQFLTEALRAVAYGEKERGTTGDGAPDDIGLRDGASLTSIGGSDGRGETGRTGGTQGADGRADEGRATDASIYATRIVPILVSRCGACHGERRQRGGLALHTADALAAGGDGGPVVVPGDPDRSELVRRLRLPTDHDDHMPPASKPQPTVDEIEAIARWIADGARTDGGTGARSDATDGIGATPTGDAADSIPRQDVPTVGDDPVDSTALGDAVPEAAPGRAEALSPDEADAVERLRASHIHVESIDPATGGLWVDYRAQPDTDGAALRVGLEPLLGRVEELSLVGTAVDDAALATVGLMPGLRRLDLSRTSATSVGVTRLRSCRNLEFLGLADTAVDDRVVDVLVALPSLTRVSLWATAVTDAGRAELAERRPDVDVLGADLRDAVEEEPELVLGDGASLAPVNGTCPVTGALVDPQVLVVHEGDVVGFCCVECPATFWAEPSAYPIGK